MFKKNQIIIILALISVSLTGCRPQNPQISYANSEFKLSSFQSINSKFNFSIYNPNSIPLNGQLDYKLFIEGQEFFAGKSSQIESPAQKTSSFYIEQDINFLQVYGSLSQLITNIADGTEDIKLRLTGQYNTNVFGLLSIPIAIDQQVSIPLPKLPKIEFSSIAVEKMDFSSVVLSVKAKAFNENEIEINLKSFESLLSVENRDIAKSSFLKGAVIPAQAAGDIDLRVELDLSKVDISLVNKLLKDPSAINLQSSIKDIL